MFVSLLTIAYSSTSFAVSQSQNETDSMQPEELVSGKVVGRHIYGLGRDFQGDPVLLDSNPLIYPQEGRHNEKLQLEDRRFIVSLFAHQMAGVYLSEWDEERAGYVDTSSLNLATVNGITQPVSAFKTPWNTVVFSEQALVDAAQPEEFIQQFKPFFKNKTELVKPYHYGWVSEVILLNKNGQSKIIKNYALGRLSASHVVAMPDDKTYYLFDSEHSGNLYVFIAAEAKSMAKGQLYLVKQAASKVDYLPMGKISALKMKFKLKKATFSKFFKSDKPENQTCKPGYNYIETVYGEECLGLVKKNKKYVGQFEPVRMAALLGGSAFIKKFSDMRYNEQMGKLEFSVAGNTEFSFSFGKNEDLQSNYILLSK
jgi:hypothetical protein